MNKTFNWDEYLKTTSYNDVLEGMEHARTIMPTMFSPDKSLVYLKTYDIAFETDNIDELRRILDELFNNLKEAARCIKWSCEQLYLLQVDYRTVYVHLYNLNALPQDYKNPEYYLEIAMKEIHVK